MHGAPLAGVLTAVAVGPILLGLLLLWTWTVFRRHHQNLNQDLEPTRLVGPGVYDCSMRNRIFHQIIFEQDVERAMEAMRVPLVSLAAYCSKKSKISKMIPLWQLRSHLHELGDGEHRLPAERLLELLPDHVVAFVGHVVITTVIGAITVSDKSHLTILHPPSFALLTEVLSHGDPDGESWRIASAHLRECMAYLIPSELSNQKGKDRLTDLLADLIADSLNFYARGDEGFRELLHDVFESAIKLGTILLRHPVEYRFDWVVGDTQSEKQVVILPKLVAVTNHLGRPRFRPKDITKGDIQTLE